MGLTAPDADPSVADGLGRVAQLGHDPARRPGELGAAPTRSGRCRSAPPAAPSSSWPRPPAATTSRASGWSGMSFSPRQADVLICAGRLPFKLAPVIRRIWDQMPQPKWSISMGACASSGGIFDNYAMVQGIDTIIPVDVYVPGLPAAARGAAVRHHAAAEEDQGREPDRPAAPRGAARSDPTGSSCPPARDRRGLRAVRQLRPPDPVRHDRRRRPPRRPSRRSGPRFGDGHRCARRASSAATPIVWVDAATGRTTSCAGCSDDPGQGYDYLTDVTAVEYRDAELPLEVVYQLRSLAAPRRPPRQGRARQGAAARGATRVRPLARRQLAGARGVRHVRHHLRGPPRPAPHPDVGDLRRGLSRCGRTSRCAATSAAPSRPARRSPPTPRRTTRSRSCPSPRRTGTCRVDMRERLGRGERGEVAMSTRTVEFALAHAGARRRGPRRSASRSACAADPRRGRPTTSAPSTCSSTSGPSTRPPTACCGWCVELDGETVMRCIPHIGYLHSRLREAGRVPALQPDHPADRPHRLPARRWPTTSASRWRPRS